MDWCLNLRLSYFGCYKNWLGSNGILCPWASIGALAPKSMTCEGNGVELLVNSQNCSDPNQQLCCRRLPHTLYFQSD